MATTAGAHASSFVVLGDQPPAASPSIVTLGEPAPAKVALAAPKAVTQTVSLADPMQAALESMKPGSWRTTAHDEDPRQAALQGLKPGDPTRAVPDTTADDAAPVILSASIMLLGGPAPAATDNEKVASISGKDRFFIPMVIRGGIVGGTSSKDTVALSPDGQQPADQAQQKADTGGQTGAPAQRQDNQPMSEPPALPAQPRSMPAAGVALPSQD